MRAFVTLGIEVPDGTFAEEVLREAAANATVTVNFKDIVNIYTELDASTVDILEVEIVE